MQLKPLFFKLMWNRQIYKFLRKSHIYECFSITWQFCGEFDCFWLKCFDLKPSARNGRLPENHYWRDTLLTGRDTNIHLAIALFVFDIYTHIIPQFKGRGKSFIKKVNLAAYFIQGYLLEQEKGALLTQINWDTMVLMLFRRDRRERIAIMICWFSVFHVKKGLNEEYIKNYQDNNGYFYGL